MRLAGLLLLLISATAVFAQAETDSAYTEQEALEEQREYDEYVKESMTFEEADLYDRMVNQLSMIYDLDYEYVDNCLTYTDVVCDFE